MRLYLYEKGDRRKNNVGKKCDGFIEPEPLSIVMAEAGDDKGWFYMIELLLRAERRGVNILDMPVTFTENYDTTVNIRKTILNYLVNIRRLRRTFKAEGTP